jgi:glycerate 2-kinase
VAVSAAQFQTASLRNHPRGEAVTRILAAAVNAVEPGASVRRVVRREGNRLTIRDQSLDLREYHQVAIISIGKAGVGMAVALGQILADRLDTGLIVTKHASPSPSRHFSVMVGAHPVPDESSLLAGQRVLELASTLTEDDLLLCLISGGGSSLVSCPVENVSLADLQSLTRTLLACGARIEEINTLRRALDRIKGGGLARAANGARVVTLIISDVIGNPLESIASGPTVPNPTGPADALAVLDKYHVRAKVPESIASYLKSADAPRSTSTKESETPSPAGEVHVIASNFDALQAALSQAEAEGLHPCLLRADLQGEAADAGLELANVLRWQAQHQDPVSNPACLVAGGETTVTLRGTGRGGRNTELALAASISLADSPKAMFVTLASDGEDGPTDAAGAVVTGETFGRALAQGLEPSDYLNRNDSYAFFAALDDLLRPGPTGTNVNDLAFLFAF